MPSTSPVTSLSTYLHNPFSLTSLLTPFSRAEFPKLTDVRGTFNAQTSGNFSCSDFNQYKKNQVVKGLYFCKAKSANVQDDVTKTQGGTLASPTGGADSEADAGSGAAGIAVSGTAMTFVGFVAAMLAL